MYKKWILLSVVVAVVLQQAAAAQRKLKYIIHYIAKSIGTPSNERFDYFLISMSTNLNV